MPADLRRHGHLLLIAALLVGTLLVVGGSRGRAEADEGPQIAVDLAADRHAIPDAVYGMSFAPPVPRARARARRRPLRRQPDGHLRLAHGRLEHGRRLLLRDGPRVLARGGRVVSRRREPRAQARPRPRRRRPRGGRAVAAHRAAARQGRRRRREVRAAAAVQLPALALPLPAGVGPAQRRLRQRPHARRAADPRRRRGHPLRDRGRARVDRRARRRLRHRRAGRRPLLRPRQRAGAVERHPPRPASRPRRLRRAVEPHEGDGRRGQGRRPERAHAVLLRVGLDGLLLQREGRPVRGLLGELPRPPGARRPGAHRVAARPRARGGGEQRAAHAGPARSPLVSAGRRHAARRHPLAVGPDLPRPVVDRRPVSSSRACAPGSTPTTPGRASR